MAQNQTQVDTTGAKPTIDTGAPVPVAVEYVEAQLLELWRDVAEAAQVRGGAQAVTMTQVLNLIVHATSLAEVNTYIGDIERTTGRHPCRDIIMIADPDEAEIPVQAWVSIHCQQPPAGGRQVCCEQVSITAGGEAIRQIPAAVIPILMADLPVFLWWPQGAPFDDYLFRQLADSIDRLIVDSSTFENPEGTLSKMAGQRKGAWPKIAITDMNWGRLTPWREMVAQFFDGQAMRPYLDRIGRVTISYALSDRGAANRAQALLVAGWLASRLNWEPVDPVYQLVRTEGNAPPSIRLSLRSGKRPITVLVNPVSRRAEVAGDIDAVKLEVVGNDPGGAAEATFVVTLSDKQEHCALSTVDITGVNPTTRTINLDAPARWELLDNELQVFSHDRVYEEALDMVGVFIRGTADTGQAQGPRKLPTGEPISAGPQHPRAGTRRPPQSPRPND